MVPADHLGRNLFACWCERRARQTSTCARNLIADASRVRWCWWILKKKKRGPEWKNLLIKAMHDGAKRSGPAPVSDSLLNTSQPRHKILMVNSWPLWIIDAKTTQKDILRLPVISRNREHEIWLLRKKKKKKIQARAFCAWWRSGRGRRRWEGCAVFVPLPLHGGD